MDIDQPSVSQPIRAVRADPKKSKRKADEASDSGSEPEIDTVDVDFEFFDPAPIDYHAIKHLLMQLFQSDAEHLALGELTDLILSQPQLGSTIKVDGKDSDPYAFLTTIDLNTHREHAAIKVLTAYLLSRAKSSFTPDLQTVLHAALEPSSSAKVGVVLGERLVNMPVQLIPHMFRMLAEELGSNGQPSPFTHFLILSRTFAETAADREWAMEEDTLAAPAKKSKNAKNPSALTAGNSLFLYHPEDEFTARFASHVADYPFEHSAPRGEDAFGVDSRGRMLLVEASKLPELVQVMMEGCS